MPTTVVADFWLACPPARAFAFFADARNLGRTTPGWFRLSLLSPLPIEMAAGARIDYRLRWRALRLRWQSHVTVWRPDRSFEYEQARGPFRSFRHDHRFLPEAGGVRIVDRIRFASATGGLLDRAVVATDLRRILRHRAVASSRLLNSRPATTAQAPLGAQSEASPSPDTPAAPNRRPRTSASSSAIEEPT